MSSQSVSHPNMRNSGTVWVMAVNQFDGVNLQTMWSLVKPLSEQFGARVEAAYVLAPASMNWTGAFSGPWMKKYAPVAQEKLTQLLPDDSLKKTIVKCAESGQRASVEALVRHATEVNADYLVISTHARSGLERLAMGSFAESVILMSSIPVLVLNPTHKLPQEIHKILVPTDLSKKSEKYIEALANYAQRLGAEIILFHKQPDPLDPIIQQGVYSLGGGWVSVQSYIDDELEAKNSRITSIETALRSSGLTVSHIFDTSPEGLVESIERAASDNGADMVSVLTQSVGWSAALLGSVARGLMRTSTIPVLVRR